MIGNFCTNSHEITTQIMRHFRQSTVLLHKEWPAIEENINLTNNVVRGTLQSQQTSPNIEILLADAMGNELHYRDITDHVILPDRRILNFFETDEYNILKKMLTEQLYNGQPINVNRQYFTVSQIQYMGETFQNQTSSAGNNIIQAQWLNDRSNGIDLTSSLKRVGDIQRIIVVTVRDGDQIHNHYIMHMKWFATHHSETYRYGMHTQTCYNHHVNEGFYSYLPIQRIISKCASYKFKHRQQKLIVFIPIPGVWAII